MILLKKNKNEIILYQKGDFTLLKGKDTKNNK